MQENTQTKLPWSGLRIVECGTQLSGRLTALLFSDQGAEVLVLADHKDDKSVMEFNEETNAYLNRGKTFLGNLSADQKNKLLESADVIIVDGESTEWTRLKQQVLLRVCAAIPGDEKWGYLPHDCDDDFLSAICGIFTDMALSPFLDRNVIYTPLRLCSVYAAVIGAVSVGAALVDRERTCEGREIVASRLAAGLGAIGALSLTISGPSLPKHLISTKISHLRKGLDLNEFEEIRKEATHSAKKQLWLEQRLFPLATPYECSDGTLFLPMATFNRRIARTLIDRLGIWPKLESLGVCDLHPYDAKNQEVDDRNLALPFNFSWQVGCEIADELEKAFKAKTAYEWETEFCNEKVACAEVLSFKQWFSDQETRNAKIVADVEGSWQIGRSAWCDTAKPYPALTQPIFLEGESAITRLSELLERKKTAGPKNQENFKPISNAMRPLEGYVVADFTNVLAGPACGRMLAELGATVYKIGTSAPFHPPVVMVTWQAEEMIGKESMMINFNSERGKEAVRRLVQQCDFALCNKHDEQLAAIGIDRSTLDAILENGEGKKIIQLQVAARKGEQAEGVKATNWPGYDPALQGKTGLMERFGPVGCPSFHGVASCVDYLTGYTSAFAGVSALYSREVNGVVCERAGTSLACCATLVQCTMQGKEPDSRGPWSKGRTAHNRVYQVGFKDTPNLAEPENWIYTQANRDLTDEALNWTEGREAFMRKLDTEGFLSTPVHTCRQIAEDSKDGKSLTMEFEKKESEGLITETFRPTWICINGVPTKCPLAATPSGIHTPKI